MAKMKLNPVTGEMDLIGLEREDFTLASLLDLIDDAAPVNTTVSASFATLLSSASTAFNGKAVLFLLNMSARLSVITDAEVEFAIQIDGGADVVIGSHFLNQLDLHQAFAYTLIQTPSEGNHTINLRWRRVAGTGTIAVDVNDRIQLKAISL